MQPALAPAPHPMQNTPQDHATEQHADAPEGPGLRQQLLGVDSPHTPLQHSLENLRPSSSASPHDQNIDPAIAGSGANASLSNDSGGEDTLDGSGKKGAKRELSTSKRAAQNRAAQRAFRQRKEGYIKKLEDQVRDLHALEENYKAIQAENYQLRDYIINLQSRLIESGREAPPLPSNIDLHHPQQAPMQQVPAPTAPMGASAVSQLQASAAQAQAVADIGSSKHHHEEAAYLAGGYPPAKRIKAGEQEPSGRDGSVVSKQELNGTSLGM
ncbi:MAG: hypothetical protein M1837_007256 [Sclerophora amabilis]|nr:MAG: hypothetical protein M1837_007256 [Sclerophora amabilis]